MRRPFTSANYLRDNSMVHEWSNLLSLLPRGTGLCLDLGCGDGKHRLEIEKRGWHWIGIDVTATNEQSPTSIADAQWLPLAANSVDLVFTNQVLEHIAHPWTAVAEAYRVLKPEGQIVGSVAFLEPFHDSYFGLSHWAIEELLRMTGFEIVEIRPGTSVFITICQHMLPDMPLGSLIGRWSGRLSMSLLKVIGGLYMALRFGKGSSEWRQYQGFWEKAPLRFSGHIMFVARKASMSVQQPGGDETSL